MRCHETQFGAGVPTLNPCRVSGGLAYGSKRKWKFMESKFIIWVRIITALSALSALAWLGVMAAIYDQSITVPVLILIPVIVLHAWAIQKKLPNTPLKVTGIITTLILSAVAVWVLNEEIYLNWFGYSTYKNRSYFSPEHFFISIGFLLIVALNLIAVLRPKLPTKATNPHIVAAYVFAVILTVLLTVLVIKL
ncbi:MAG: hypothetical protein JEZ10_03870 [Verrucomicrobia bacterium]|nr:hypothetical protein [Verrucomicrobiota bacterium]